MSGFITTMFVSSPSSNLFAPSFPAKPKPAMPVFTAVQSQSCMYLGMDMLELKENGNDAWMRREDGKLEALARFKALAPVKPARTYKSPLQRIGEALRTTQGGIASSAIALDTEESDGDRKIHLLAPLPSSTSQLLPGEASPACEFTNYSYKLLPGGQSTPTREQVEINWVDGSGLSADRQPGWGTVSIPRSGVDAQPPRNHGYFTGASLLSSLPFSNPRTRAPFKPQKSNRGTSTWQLKQYAEATLGSGSLRKAVKLPEGEDKDEWLAVNVVDFYNQINLLYGSITEFCSPQSCPEMKATDEFEYLWQDSETYKKPTKMPAPEYIEHLMAWVQSNIDNEAMFPARNGVPFPKAFPSLIRNMFKRLYRVYAHIYCHHYPVIIELGLEPHLNTSFKHYVLFIDEHGLASGSKDFWGPLGDLVESMLRSD
ncbi:hypothetical protein P154DRAFT_354405 [Amniculicola lignicola CBS 123094]|uniref:Maintenance of ploidy protein mob1 n=1 Tax=Amniculicola lignicola CBS 123094 TaxID=1392246 RepID=A0A6A5WUC7_9PLEO|nr:hypothetical protein P154DRAFT_354405 [Amniculicola lignicola CBS 123094]